MPLRIDGIIVSYRPMQGVVLLRHKSVRSIEVLAKTYYKSQVDDGFWFAKFQWQDIPLSQRRGLDCWKMLGRLVVCEAIKDPKWRCISVSFVKDKKQYQVPTRSHIRNEIAQKINCGSKESQKDLRKQRRNQRMASNAFRPWGGMSR